MYHQASSVPLYGSALRGDRISFGISSMSDTLLIPLVLRSLLASVRAVAGRRYRLEPLAAHRTGFAVAAT
jgi:hypothetical protein